MPIYMHCHDLSVVTAKDVAQAHQEDLKIQDQFGCKGLTYWFDKERGAAFCLIEAPSIEAVKEMHKYAHGDIAHQIIEVDSRIVETFLGRIQDPVFPLDKEDSGLVIINDPAFRALLTIEMEEYEFINPPHCWNQYWKFTHSNILIINDIISQFRGRRVEHVKDGVLISFKSISNALSAAIEIQKKSYNLAKDFGLTQNSNIGLSAGVPINNDKNFFGESIQESFRLCKTAKAGQIWVSTSVSAYLSEDKLTFLSKHAALKIMKPAEEKFIKQLRQVMDNFWKDPEFSVQLLYTSMNLSKSQMYRKLIALTGLAPNDFIKDFRLKKSLRILTETKKTIAEIAYESGFNSPSYFSKCFLDRYGISPSNYFQSKKI